MSVLKNIPTAIQYLFDKNVPLRKKTWLIIAAIYVVSPIDLIPEPVLGLGIIDDITVVAYILNSFSTKLEQYKYERATRKKEAVFKDKIIEDVDYEIKDDKNKEK